VGSDGNKKIITSVLKLDLEGINLGLMDIQLGSSETNMGNKMKWWNQLGFSKTY